MINYAYILSRKEKDNPSPICRGSYLFSNVGDLVKCYGRKLRFPKDAKIYEAEMKLALGDIIMQCRLIEEEYGIKRHEWEDDRNSADDIIFTDIYVALRDITNATNNVLILMIESEQGYGIPDNELEINIRDTMTACYNLCKLHDWTPEDISHLGFLHVMERFEQFEREMWK